MDPAPAARKGPVMATVTGFAPAAGVGLLPWTAGQGRKGPICAGGHLPA